ncbi:hypothetical protein BKA69DRAFT_444902 [Paraphysoderma sedebokerense]|nr:hypothetical protein BKA69DRAFT_444902 [Paraphysoderma sedebokerense]
MSSGYRLSTMSTSSSGSLRPLSSDLNTYLTQYYNDADRMENTLDEMSNSKMDPAFKEELTAIENWFKVLSEPERTSTLYTLFQYLTPVQIRFFLNILQQLAKRNDPNWLYSPAVSERGDSRPPSMMSAADDGGFSGDMLNERLNAMRNSQSLSRRLFDRHSLNVSDAEHQLRNLDISDSTNGYRRPKSIEGELFHPQTAIRRPKSVEFETAASQWNSPSPRLANNLEASVKILETLTTANDAQPLVQDPYHLSPNVRHNRGSSHSRSSSPAMPGRPTSPAPIGPPSRPSSPRPASNPAALATGAYYASDSTQASPPGTKSSSPGRRSSSESREAVMKSNGSAGGAGIGSIDFEILEDIPRWLKSLRLHKYTPNLEHMKWRRIIELTDEDLSTLGVSALGARTKFLKIFSQIKEEGIQRGLL